MRAVIKNQPIEAKSAERYLESKFGEPLANLQEVKTSATLNTWVKTNPYVKENFRQTLGGICGQKLKTLGQKVLRIYYSDGFDGAEIDSQSA